MKIIDWMVKYPTLAFAVGVASLLDAANCVRLEHEDWWFPALIAFGSGFLISAQEGEG